MFRVRNQSDLIAGLSVMVIAGVFLYVGAGLRIGTVTRMAAGFFPTMLAWALLALGAAMCVKSLIVSAKEFERPKARPLFLIATGPIAFGILTPRVGLFLTVVVVSLIARFALREAWKIDSLVLPVALAAFCSLVFVTLLGQPIPLWP